MDTNKNHLLYFVFLLLLPCWKAAGQEIVISGRVYNAANKEAVEAVHVALYQRDSVFLQGVATDGEGVFRLEGLSTDDYWLVVSCLGFETRRIGIQHITESMALEVALYENVRSLEEVAVVGAAVVSRISQRIVFPTRQQLSHSANGLQLLNMLMLPGLRVNPMVNTVAAMDGGTVILQINGVPVGSEEIQTLRPSQIRRIEYTDYAGVRYEYGTKVVNYIVKREERGGVVGVDLMNSVNSWSAGDVLFARFSRGKSEYAVNYVLAFQDFNDNGRIRSGRFDFGDRVVTREEHSDGGAYVSQMHDISLGYHWQRSDSTFFNARLKYTLTRQPHNDFRTILRENGSAEGRIFDGAGQRIQSPTLDIYYQQGLKKGQQIYFNLVGSYFRTESHRNHVEYNTADTLLNESFLLDSDKYSLIGEGIYEKVFNRGSLKMGAKYLQAYTRQHIVQNERWDSHLRQSESALLAEWKSEGQVISYSVGLRLNRLFISSGRISNAYFSFLPKAMVGVRLGEYSLIRYDLEMSQTNPMLVELTEAEVSVDNYLKETGNSSLQPYRNLNSNLFYEQQKGIFTLNLHLRHHYKHEPIMESKHLNGDYFLMRPENARNWNRWNAEFTTRIGMIRNILQFSLTGGYNHFKSSGSDYKHTYSHGYYRADLLAIYGKWMFIGQLQPFEERLEGETVIKEGNYHYLALQYNTDHLSVGIGFFNPFKNVSRTIRDNRNILAPLRQETFSKASQNVVVTLTWNFSFGKPQSTGSKSLENSDKDYGVRGGDR